MGPPHEGSIRRPIAQSVYESTSLTDLTSRLPCGCVAALTPLVMECIKAFTHLIGIPVVDQGISELGKDDEEDSTMMRRFLTSRAALPVGAAAGRLTDEHWELTEQALFRDQYTIVSSFSWVAKQRLALFRANGQPRETTQHQSEM